MAKSLGKISDNNAGTEGLEDIRHQIEYLYIHDAVNNKWIRAEGDVNGKLKVLTEADPLPSFSTVTHTTLSVSSTSIQALASNANRKYAFFQNNSNQNMYLSLSGAATNNAGILLRADGGQYTITLNNLFTGQINVILPTGGTRDLLITEGT